MSNMPYYVFFKFYSKLLRSSLTNHDRAVWFSFQVSMEKWTMFGKMRDALGNQVALVSWKLAFLSFSNSNHAIDISWWEPALKCSQRISLPVRSLIKKYWILRIIPWDKLYPAMEVFRPEIIYFSKVHPLQKSGSLKHRY